MSVTLYILEFILCSAIFVALYKLFIEARVSHRYSRIYLVWSMIFSAVVPLLELPLYPAQTIYYELPIITYEQPEILPTPEPMPAVDATPAATPQPKPTDWARVAAIVAASIYGLIVLTDNPEKLLPTVRSRCTELSLQALPEDTLQKALSREFPKASGEDISAAISRSGGWLGQAKQLLADGEALPPQTEGFVNSFSRRDALGLVQTLVPMEKWKRDQLVPVLASWIGILEEALACRAGMGAVSAHARTLSAGRSSQELMAAVQALKKARDYAMGNVSPAAVCGWLQWQLR